MTGGSPVTVQITTIFYHSRLLLKLTTINVIHKYYYASKLLVLINTALRFKLLQSDAGRFLRCSEDTRDI